MIIAHTAWMFSTLALAGAFVAVSVYAAWLEKGPGGAFAASFAAPYFALIVIVLSFGASALCWGLLGKW